MTQYQTSIVPANLWDNIRKRGQLNVRVKLIGSVGVGNSSLATDLVEIYDAKHGIVEVFPSGGQATGMPSGSKTATVNPNMLPPKVTMTIQDGDGVAGVGDSNIKNTEKNLQDMIDAPAVLLLVAKAGRGVGFFEAGRNIACIDCDGDRRDFLQLIRAKLCDLRPVKMSCTYSQLVATAHGEVASLDKMRKALQATFEAKKADVKWHEKQRIEDMGIA
ncbi:hypothetical protein GGF32_005741 [Allomyces javanicus]|nr:hypothetical protein GGF32_005741 [Allomyces javanicus]